MRYPGMLVFLDFEASSLSDHSYPIEVAWVFEDGAGESHLIRPAPHWNDWDPAAEAIHRIPMGDLLANGRAHEAVAQRMVDVLTGHDLCASAPSWDGKWLSALLRAAGLPRRALRLRGTDAVLRETALEILAPVIPAATLHPIIEKLLQEAGESEGVPVHRALADAEQERRRWLRLREAAQATARADRLG